MLVRAVVTSNVRGALPGEPSAYLRVVDLDSGSLLLTTRIPESLFRAHDPNPRGGQRGGRGLSVHDGRLVVANAERLYVLDTSWRLVDELSHPLAADIHDVLAEEDGILDRLDSLRRAAAARVGRRGEGRVDLPQ